MKQGIRLFVCAVALLLVSIPPVTAQMRQTRQLRRPLINSVVLDDFDSPDNQWIVRGSRFINEDFLEWEWVRAWPEALYRQEPEGRTLRALGLRAAFNRIGYNFLEIIPAEENDEGELVPRAIPIPGTAQSIDLWVWGSNRNYYIDVQLRDHRGLVHTLRLGDINFRGWSNLFVDIPTWIPQDSIFVPQRQGLELIKLVLWTRPQERVNEFFVYLDELRVVTNLAEDYWDGEQLADPEQVQELWNEARGM
ncbi:MAG: flagellar filament outer layer protein FlaA [Spirochaetaceae bacterium]|nr:MAG: flagellar filament outer layer protein FlaA [Spirochaetaceae bacterium]